MTLSIPHVVILYCKPHTECQNVSITRSSVLWQFPWSAVRFDRSLVFVLMIKSHLDRHRRQLIVSVESAQQLTGCLTVFVRPDCLTDNFSHQPARITETQSHQCLFEPHLQQVTVLSAHKADWTNCCSVLCWCCRSKDVGCDAAVWNISTAIQ